MLNLDAMRILRNKSYARAITKKIRNVARRLGRSVKIMNFCGTHEYTITYYGIRSLMPPNVELIAGPGCPVCITPARVIDMAIAIADSATILTYGDMYKVPGSRESLASARSKGKSVRVVYSFLDAIEVARSNPNDEFVFLGVGFETTIPTVASYIAEKKTPKNLFVLSSYRLTPPIMRFMLESKKIGIDGIIAPGHVSAIIGAGAWEFVASEFGVPIVVAGFEPIDVLLAILEILKQLLESKARLVNEYSRVVKWEGNLKAKQYISEVFEISDGDWRGIGNVPKSAYVFKDEYRSLDASTKYSGLDLRESVDVKPGCKCPEITLGLAKPTDCPYFGKACTPEHPIGPCMVSSEGTCSIWFRYGGTIELSSAE